jgi:drug/metabolite transporter (DMT)-like permease
VTRRDGPASVSKTLIYGIAIFANLLWAGAYVTGKIAIGTDGSAGFGPFRAAFFRFAAAGAVLALWGLVRAPESLRVRREDLPRFGRLALLGMCLTYVFNYTGLALTTGTSAALIMATEPVWIAVLAVLVLRERLTPTRGLGVLLGLGGALLVIVSTTQPVNGADGSAAASAAMLGNALIAASLLWEASAVLTVKRLVARYPGPVIVTYEFLLGSLLLAPFAAWETAARGPIAPSPAAWGAFLYLLGPCTLFGYTVWFKLLEVADASELSVFIFLQPVAGTLMGVFLFRDPFTAVTALGAALVLAGVGGITRAGAAAKPPLRSVETSAEVVRPAHE